MTGNFEQPKHRGASAAWPEASCVSLRSQGLAQPGTNLVRAEVTLTPEELAGYAFSLRSPRGSHNLGSRCQTPGFTKRPAGAAALFQVSSALAALIRRLCASRNRGATGPIPCLRLGRYVRFNWVAVADRPRAPGHPSGKTESSQAPETGSHGSMREPR
jgi:hypothetical protein